jgi:hypothetical protein
MGAGGLEDGAVMGRRIDLLLLGIVALATCGIGGLLGLPVLSTPTLWQQPPLYPGAQQVQTQDYGEGRWLPNGYYVVKQITFRTPDSPAQVLDFYRQQLAPNGSLGAPSSLGTFPDRLLGHWQPFPPFAWSTSRPCPIWTG